MLTFLPITCVCDLKLTKLADPQTHWHSGVPPGVTNTGSVFETQASIRGISCASQVMWFLGFEPRARNHYKRLQHAPFFVVLVCVITRHLTMKWFANSFYCYCGGCSYRQVAHELPNENPLSSSSILSIIATASNGMRHAAYVGGYCTAQLPLAIVPITRRLPQDPLRQSMGGVLTRDGHTLFPMGSSVMVDAFVRPSQAINPIHVCKTYYAARALATLDTICSANR